MNNKTPDSKDYRSVALQFLLLLAALYAVSSTGSAAVVGTAINGVTNVTWGPSEFGWRLLELNDPLIYTIRTTATFDGGGPVEAVATNHKLGVTSATVGPIVGLHANEFARGMITHDGDLGSVAGIDVLVAYSYQLGTEASAGTLPTPPVRHTTSAITRYIDPTPFLIGQAGTTLDLNQSIRVGTTIQGSVSGQGPFMTTFSGRFADSSILDPDLFWPDNGSLPLSAFNLYTIDIFGTDGGGVNANVQLFPSTDSDFSVSFSATAAQIKAAIEAASWSATPAGTLVLNADLPLVNLGITNLSGFRFGDAATIGVSASVPAFDQHSSSSSIPETGSVIFMMSFGVASCIVLHSALLRSSRLRSRGKENICDKVS